MYNKKESGVALLFAIGFLSLLLILGLAFVSNSLLAKKAALNNSYRSQAKMLAYTAAHRIAASAMALQYCAQEANTINGSVMGFAPEDFSGVYSVNDSDDANNSGDALKDQLDIKMSGSWDERSLSDNKNKGYKWNYVYSDAARTKIIGRFAYAVIPEVASGSLTMYNVLGGVYPRTSGGSDTPWTCRIGATVDELNLNNSTVLKNWSSLCPDAKTDVPKKFDSLFNQWSANLFASDTKRKESWIQRWFIEGDDPEEKEGYMLVDRSGSAMIHRFNLGTSGFLGDAAQETSPAPQIDSWYCRFFKKSDSAQSSANRTFIKNYYNKSAVLNRLMSKDLSNSEFLQSDTVTPHEVSLPYLNNVGSSSEIGGFESLDNLRYQIAANLNDYCDSDSIPTSNISATSWDVGNAPSFTGNEKTLYINEIAMALKHQVTFDGTKIHIDLSPSVIAELIDVYNISSDDVSYSLATNIKSITVKYDVKAEFSGTYKNLIGQTKSFSVDGDKALSMSSDSQTFSAGYPVTINFTKDTGHGNSGYYVAAGSEFLLKPDGAEHTATFDFDSSIKNKIASIFGTFITILSCDFNKLSIKITGLSVKFDNMVLKKKDMKYFDDNGEEQTGAVPVDYVRIRVGTDSELTPEVNNKTAYLFADKVDSDSLLEKSVFSDTAKNKIYIFGMEAKDPRQNLNAWVYDGSGALTAHDWKLSPKIAPYTWEDGNGNGTDAPSFSANLTKGFKNSTAVPSSGDDNDHESCGDPAWRGSGSTQHLSTAYIRNGVMKSPWELGVIHRGYPWQTINLKKAAKGAKKTEQNDSFSIRYSEGDAGILEQVKFTAKPTCYGKVDLNSLLSNSKNYDSYNADMGAALFEGVRLGEEISSFDGTGGSAISHSTAVNIAETIKNHTTEFENRIGLFTLGDFAGGFGNLSLGENDAQQEEFVGKTINLMKTTKASNQIHAIVIAQTIKDIEGQGIIKFLHNGNPTASHNCTLGTFDLAADSSAPDGEPKFVYFDEITGEVKALVTIKRDSSVSGQSRLNIKNIEFIE